jgi:hypothetical protein
LILDSKEVSLCILNAYSKITIITTICAMLHD